MTSSPCATKAPGTDVYSRSYKSAVALPPVVWVSIFLFIPYLLLLAHSFWTLNAGQIEHVWQAGNYAQLMRNPMYLQVLLRSMRIAASVTALALIMAYPLAYYLSFYAPLRKDLLYQLVIIPLWVSYLVRGYAWKTILGSEGVLNGVLRFAGITQAPLEWLLYSPFAVTITLTHIYTPFVFLPIFAALEHIPRPLLEASQDLGASPRRTFWKVLLPLSLPGVLAGCLFAFVLTLGDFLAPLLVGGPSGIMISNVVVSLFGAAYNWPLGAAVSVVMMLLVLALIGGAERLEKRFSYT